MSVGITELAFSIRKLTSGSTCPISLSRAQQLVCAALGHKSFASFQVAQSNEKEPQSLHAMPHVVPDYDLLYSRAGELSIKLSSPQLRILINQAFKERMPGTQLHGDYSDLADSFREIVEDAAISDDRVSSAMAEANFDGVDEVYCESDLAPNRATVDGPFTENARLTITLGLDLDRPYCGHIVKCSADVTMVRCGRCCFEVPEVEVVSAYLEWGDRDPTDDDYLPPKTLTQALAAELNIDEAEAEQLVWAEPQELTGASGEMVYGYLFDFSAYASPELAAKLLQSRGSLKLQVGPWFFEGVESSDFAH